MKTTLALLSSVALMLVGAGCQSDSILSLGDNSSEHPALLGATRSTSLPNVIVETIEDPDGATILNDLDTDDDLRTFASQVGKEFWVRMERRNVASGRPFRIVTSLFEDADLTNRLAVFVQHTLPPSEIPLGTHVVGPPVVDDPGGPDLNDMTVQYKLIDLGKGSGSVTYVWHCVIRGDPKLPGLDGKDPS